MVLRSGTTTHSKGVTKRSRRISKHSKVNQHLPFLCTCFKSTGKQQKEMIANANKGQIEAVGEIALNLLKGNILIPNSSFKVFRYSFLRAIPDMFKRHFSRLSSV